MLCGFQIGYPEKSPIVVKMRSYWPFSVSLLLSLVSSDAVQRVRKPIFCLVLEVFAFWCLVA
jgi:hypothetical protein